jgi:hypothetical protein
MSAGQQWKIPVSEIARLKQEGVPPVPIRVDDEAEEAPIDRKSEGPEQRYANPSEPVIEAAEEVQIAGSRLQKRRLEREAEEVEDWFRERQRRQAGEQAAIQTEKHKRVWLTQWLEHALRSLPQGAPRELELQVHANVQEALAGLEPSHPAAITTRLVAAAVAKALKPWNCKQEVERAIQAAMNRLAWEVRCGSGFAELKQRAWDAAVTAAGKVRADASYEEVEAATGQAVQPVIREYGHVQACRRVLEWTYVSGATTDEQDAASEAARKAIAALSIGTTEKQMQQAKETALAPFVAAVARRNEAARLKAEQESNRRTTEWRVILELGHIARYLEQEYEFDGGYSELRQEAERLRPLVREALIEEVLENPEMTVEEIRQSMEDFIDDEL